MSKINKIFPRRRTTFSCGDELITKQSHKAECDITTILNQFKRTGIINHISRSSARYEDLPLVQDYQEALNMVIEAQQAFDQLPSKIRDRYANDPSRLLAALDDPKNAEELRSLGILKELPVAAPPSPGEPKGEA